MRRTLTSVRELAAQSRNSDCDLSIRALVCSRELARLITELETL